MTQKSLSLQSSLLAGFLLAVPVMKVQAGFIITDNFSAIEIDGTLEAGITTVNYYDFDETLDTLLPVTYSNALSDQVSLSGGLSQANASLDLSVVSVGTSVDIDAMLDTSGVLQRGSTDYAELSAVSAVDIFFTLDSDYSYSYSANADSSLRPGSLFEFATLFSVQGMTHTEIIDLETTNDTDNWNGAGLLPAGDYYLSIQVDTAFINTDVDTGANGQFAMSLEQTAVVPLPGSLLLMLSGLLGLTAFGKRH